jgi:hypothetical protein
VEPCCDSTAIQTFHDDGNLVVKTELVPTVYRVATEELREVYAGVQPEKSSRMVPSHALVDDIRELVSIVTGTRTEGVPLAMDF